MFPFILISFLFFSCSSTKEREHYPSHWWKPVEKSDLKSWEISPDTAKAGEVILSKRNELGLLSNFAPTPFELDGKKYATVEGLWQSMKYPENQKDPRWAIKEWPYKRSEVEQMEGFTAKKAGDFGSKAMKKLNIDWVSYQGKTFPYRTSDKGEHYNIILRAMQAKLEQNPKVKAVLLKTGDLILLPDHKVGTDDPPAWRYYKIWMDIRSQLKQN